jgi:hypothetical protein
MELFRFKGQLLFADYGPQGLLTDVGDQELAQLGQDPARKPHAALGPGRTG